MANEQMEFPKTWEEYEKDYGFNDSKEVYTNNSRLIPSFRVKQWLDHLPSIQPKTGHWIPVSERLPENHDDVLVWFEYVKDDWDCAWWGLAYYSLQYKKWVVSTNERNPIVKAWIPLPEPYEPTDSEKE